MTVDQWLGLGAITLLVALIAFAFFQGDQIKPSGKDPTSRNDYT